MFATSVQAKNQNLAQLSGELMSLITELVNKRNSPIIMNISYVTGSPKRISTKTLPSTVSPNHIFTHKQTSTLISFTARFITFTNRAYIYFQLFAKFRYASIQ